MYYITLHEHGGSCSVHQCQYTSGITSGVTQADKRIKGRGFDICTIYSHQERQYTYERNVEERSRKAVLHNSVCVCVCGWARKSVHVRAHACSLTYPTCNAHAPYCIPSFEASLTLSYFSTLSHRRHDFRKQVHVLYK
jgi:hypothetical protein